jgi:hypothetical protein
MRDEPCGTEALSILRGIRPPMRGYVRQIGCQAALQLELHLKKGTPVAIYIISAR